MNSQFQEEFLTGEYTDMLGGGWYPRGGPAALHAPHHHPVHLFTGVFICILGNKPAILSTVLP